MKNTINSENNTETSTSNYNKKNETNRVLKIIIIVCYSIIALNILAYGVGYLAGTIEAHREIKHLNED